MTENNSEVMETIEQQEGNKLVCFVDDAFIEPAREISCDLDEVFYNCKLKELVEKTWGDSAVKNLCSALIDDKWTVQAFSNPEYYRKKLEKDVFISDILIFDWEYPAIVVEHVAFLKEIMSNHSVHVYIYSGANEQEKIQDLIDAELEDYKNRIEFLSKYTDDSKSVDTVQQFTKKLEELRKINFSVALGPAIRKVISTGTENVLSEFANMDLKNVLKLLSHDGKKSEELSKDIKELLSSKISEHLRTSTEIKEILKNKKISDEAIEEIIVLLEGKIKNSIISTSLPTPKDPIAKAEENGNKAMQKLWSFRLYNRSSKVDMTVRTGDIIRAKDDESFSKLFLVVTDNCSLTRFGSKTGGVLNTIELVRVSDHSGKVKADKNLRSLTNTSGFGSTDGKPLLLPYLPLPDETMADYLLFMQKHVPIEFKYTAEEKQLSLSYDKIEYSRVCSIDSLFLHPLIGTIVTDLFGWGCPDYPALVQEDLKKRCKPPIKSEEGGGSS